MPANSREDGYALTEVLVASVIAAAVVAMAMSGMTVALRGARGAADMQDVLLEGANISGRLRAGDRAANVAADYPDWRISISAVDRPVDPRTGAVLTRARLEHTAPRLALDFIFVEDGYLLTDDEP
ncbi:hypothetical protein [Maricaulis sp.]|uniref:hypothetical protein n=1 Tax=Maricaulis sp. TaxID=1486257 RepID=UPI003A8F9A69